MEIIIDDDLLILEDRIGGFSVAIDSSGNYLAIADMKLLDDRHNDCHCLKCKSKTRVANGSVYCACVDCSDCVLETEAITLPGVTRRFINCNGKIMLLV